MSEGSVEAPWRAGGAEPVARKVFRLWGSKRQLPLWSFSACTSLSLAHRLTVVGLLPDILTATDHAMVGSMEARGVVAKGLRLRANGALQLYLHGWCVVL